MELATCITRLTSQFLSPFFEPPGYKAQVIMSPTGREKLVESYKIQYRKSAVLLLIYPDKEQQANTLFIVRNTYNGAHSGQISLPGGAFEKKDLNLIQTAIRETEEEVGIRINNEFILGQLSHIKIPVSGFEVTPVVAYTNEPPKFKPDSREVRDIIEIPIKKLISLPKESGKFGSSSGFNITAPFYPLGKHRLWGATAMIISEFRELMK